MCFQHRPNGVSSITILEMGNILIMNNCISNEDYGTIQPGFHFFFGGGGGSSTENVTGLAIFFKWFSV